MMKSHLKNYLIRTIQYKIIFNNQFMDNVTLVILFYIQIHYIISEICYCYQMIKIYYYTFYLNGFNLKSLINQ
ncbi:hypothetical protein XBKB1_1240030 [Xenorhabdus bovienii str. kraussei Becker Underwood]|uniref:Transmembrane protein n=1 Tax=Xenorhabdus bovienii str. kraussei Becker Underwood TaxID=1398204 RepID=A0A077PNE3_XENBV|nr:hypothetical protein XBKB1_1240030 [Xenorhabdus bovienii str. kraussei Becker Underwood]